VVILCLYFINVQHRPIRNGIVIIIRYRKSFPNPNPYLILILISYTKIIVIYEKGRRNQDRIFHIKFLFNLLNRLRKIVKESPLIKRQKMSEVIIDVIIAELSDSPSLS